MPCSRSAAHSGPYASVPAAVAATNAFQLATAAAIVTGRAQWSSVRSAMKFKRQNVVFFSANALDPTFSVHGSTSSPPFPMAPPRALAALVALVAATLVADAAATDAFSEARTLGRAEFVSCPA